MSKILIVYASSTGNTESIAEKLGTILSGAGQDVTVRNAAGISPDNLADGYDAVLLGSSAWGLDELELQEDFVPLADNFGAMGLQGKKVGAFASGDSSYEHFCGAVDLIEREAAAAGAELIGSGLRVEGDATAGAEEIQEFADEVLKAL